MAFRITHTQAKASLHGLLRAASVIGPTLALTWALSACDKTPSKPPTPTTGIAPYATVPTAAGTAGTSVPDAAAVLASAPAPEPTPAAKVELASGRSNTEMSLAQESAAMPLPGQNNDHSAPLIPAKPASQPQAKVQ